MLQLPLCLHTGLAVHTQGRDHPERERAVLSRRGSGPETQLFLCVCSIGQTPQIPRACQRFRCSPRWACRLVSECAYINMSNCQCVCVCAPPPLSKQPPAFVQLAISKRLTQTRWAPPAPPAALRVGIPPEPAIECPRKKRQAFSKATNTVQGRSPVGGRNTQRERGRPKCQDLKANWAWKKRC